MIFDNDFYHDEAVAAFGGFDNDDYSEGDADHGDDDLLELEYPEYEIFEDYTSQFDDDPNPYHGDYADDYEGEMPYEGDWQYDDYCPEFDG